MDGAVRGIIVRTHADGIASIVALGMAVLHVLRRPTIPIGVE
jgi:hypothetical protein